MKKLLLTLVAALAATTSFAQKPVDAAQSFTAPTASAIQKVSAERLNFKAGAPAKAPEIITDQPAGDLKVYNRAGSSYRYNSTTKKWGVASQEGLTMSIVTAEDGKTVYMKEMLAYLSAGSWVKGTKEGNTITVPLNQYVFYSSTYGYGLQLCIADVALTDGVATAFTKDTEVTEITFTINADGSIKLNGTSAEKVLAFSWDDDNTLYNQCPADFGTTLTPFSEETVTPPDAASAAETYTLETTYQSRIEGSYSTPLNVRFYNDKVYIQGIGGQYVSDGWIEGTKDTDGNYVFKTGQYLGLNDGDAVYFVYSADGETLTDATFTYNEEAGTFSVSSGYVFINGKKSEFYYYHYYSRPFIYKGKAYENVLVDAPAGTPVTYTLTAKNSDSENVSHKVSVVIDGTDVYFKGFCAELPDAWMKGFFQTEEGTTYAAFEPQYIGIVDKVNYYVMGSYNGPYYAVFEYDEANNTFSTEGYVYLSGSLKRIAWFDYYTGITITKDNADGISSVKATAGEADGAVYNLAGQRVDKSFKGIVVKNGKKFVQK